MQQQSIWSVRKQRIQHARDRQWKYVEYLRDLLNVNGIIHLDLKDYDLVKTQSASTSNLQRYEEDSIIENKTLESIGYREVIGRYRSSEQTIMRSHNTIDEATDVSSEESRTVSQAACQEGVEASRLSALSGERVNSDLLAGGVVAALSTNVACSVASGGSNGQSETRARFTATHWRNMPKYRSSADWTPEDYKLKRERGVEPPGLKETLFRAFQPLEDDFKEQPESAEQDIETPLECVLNLEVVRFRNCHPGFQNRVVKDLVKGFPNMLQHCKLLQSWALQVEQRGGFGDDD